MMTPATLKAGLDVTQQFISVGKELASLPALVLPQYQSAAHDLYQICQKILSANENMARWLHKFGYFDFRQPNAAADFSQAVTEYGILRSGIGIQQLKFSCGDIDLIYRRSLSSKLINLFVITNKLEEAEGVFIKLTNADLGMVEFAQQQVLDKIGNFLQVVESSVDAGNLNEAEKLRLEFKGDTKEVVRHLEEFSDDLSELVLEFAKIAGVPITL